VTQLAFELFFFGFESTQASETSIANVDQIVRFHKNEFDE